MSFFEGKGETLQSMASKEKVDYTSLEKMNKFLSLSWFCVQQLFFQPGERNCANQSKGTFKLRIKNEGVIRSERKEDETMWAVRGPCNKAAGKQIARGEKCLVDFYEQEHLHGIQSVCLPVV